MEMFFSLKLYDKRQSNDAAVYKHLRIPRNSLSPY